MELWVENANTTVACVAGGIVGARNKVLAAEPREEWGGGL